LTNDFDVCARFWLFDYFPDLIRIDRQIFPPITDFKKALGSIDTVDVPIPADCVDGFLGAYWKRPSAYLDPLIREGIVEPWAARMRELGKRENVWCKLSGMVTEAERSSWTPETLRPYLEVVVEAFGVRRLMAGSDWPVCLVASEYGRWFDVLREYFAGFSESEKDAVFGGNAIEVYGLE